MDTPAPRDETGLAEIVAVLVLVQGAILVAGTIEALVFASVVGPSGGGSLVLAGLAAVVTLACAWGIGRRRRVARHWTLVAETVVLAVALVDAGLAVALAASGPTLMTVLSRMVIPIVVIATLRRPVVRDAFARDALAGTGGAA